MTGFNSKFALLILVSALSLGACKDSGAVPGSAINPNPVNPGNPGTSPAATDAKAAIVIICDLGKSDPNGKITLPDLNATDGAKDELRAQATDALTALDAISPFRVVLTNFVDDQPVLAGDACQALEAQPVGDGIVNPAPATGDLVSAITSIGPATTYSNLSLIEKACGDGCPDLPEFTLFLQAGCASAADCDDPNVAGILLYGKPPTSSQERAGVCPATGCVPTGDILTSVEEWLASKLGAAPVPGDAVVPSDSFDSIIAALSTAGAPALTGAEIKDLVLSDCADCGDTLDALLKSLEDMAIDGTILDPDVLKTAEALSAGDAVAPADAANAFQFAHLNLNP